MSCMKRIRVCLRPATSLTEVLVGPRITHSSVELIFLDLNNLLQFQKGMRSFRATANFSGLQLTCRECQLDLLFNYLKGNKIVLLIKSSVIEKQSIPFPGCKPRADGKKHILQKDSSTT